MTGALRRAYARWFFSGCWVAGVALAMAQWVSMGGPLL